MRIQAPRGTSDVLPGQAERWKVLEAAFFETAATFGYSEVRTPTFEETGLFDRTAGETSDIVTKQMYTFIDKGDRSMTLKPEGTAPVIRMAIQNSLLTPGQHLRLCYETAIYRYERPQKGRLREAHQFGLELLGSSSPLADAEIIEASVCFYQKIGLDSLTVLINSLGTRSARANYQQALLKHAQTFLQSQPEEIQQKAAKNPLRLLDSKDPETIELMKSAPIILDYLEESSKEKFDVVKSELTRAKISFEVCPQIVRGLDYYSETVFEIQSDLLGAQGALCGGGRYDGLIKELGGPDMPAVGVGMGIERALIVLEQAGTDAELSGADAFLAAMDAGSFDDVRNLARTLRANGLKVVLDLDMRSAKSQLRQADKSESRFAVMVGAEERASGSAQVKDLKSSQQTAVKFEQLPEFLSGRRKG